VSAAKELVGDNDDMASAAAKVSDQNIFLFICSLLVTKRCSVSGFWLMPYIYLMQDESGSEYSIVDFVYKYTSVSDIENFNLLLIFIVLGGAKHQKPPRKSLLGGVFDLYFGSA
jgi:hypothetical protein